MIDALGIIHDWLAIWEHQLGLVIVITIGLLGCVASAWFSVRDKPDDTDWDGDIAPYPMARRHDEATQQDRAA